MDAVVVVIWYIKQITRHTYYWIPWINLFRHGWRWCDLHHNTPKVEEHQDVFIIYSNIPFTPRFLQIKFGTLFPDNIHDLGQNKLSRNYGIFLVISLGGIRFKCALQAAKLFCNPFWPSVNYANRCNAISSCNKNVRQVQICFSKYVTCCLNWNELQPTSTVNKNEMTIPAM